MASTTAVAEIKVKEEEEVKDDDEKQTLLKLQILGSLYPYYRYLFPNRLVYNWLSSGFDAKCSKQREFAFKQSKDDIVIRYQQYANPFEFYKGILSHMPIKIDVGGLYEQRHTPYQTDTELITYSRELIFDIDVDAYSLRNCGCKTTPTGLCNQCWILMEAAIIILSSNLELDFGFEDIQFFYSGRRGIHCWVRDANARVLDNNGRTAILEYIRINNLDKLNKLRYNNELIYTLLHPKVLRDFESLEMMFPRYCRNQNLYLGEKGYDDLVDHYIHNNYEKNQLLDQLRRAENESELRYLNPRISASTITLGNPAYPVFKHHVLQLMYRSRYPSYDLRKCLVLVVFQHLYPRLDEGVTKTINHLLRCPFSVHGETGKICVPIASINEFNLDQVPTVMQVVKELEAIDHSDKFNKYKFNWKSTSLAPFIYSLLSNGGSASVTHRVDLELTNESGTTD